MTPKKFDQVQQASWTGRALVKDKKSNRSAILNMEIYAEKNGNMRLDATSSLGVHVFSLLLKGNQVSYIIIPEKKYYEGASRSDVFKPVMSVPVQPTDLRSLLFDQRIANKTWSCAVDKQKFLSKCTDLKNKITVSWKERIGERRIIEIDHESGRVQLSLNSFEDKIDGADQKFQLKIPPSFQKITL